MNVERVKDFAELTAKKREVKKLLSEIEAKLTEWEAQILDDFATEGISQMKVATSDGVFTCFPRLTTRAGVAEGHSREEAVSAVKGVPELNFLIKEDFNLNSLTSALKEMKEHQPERDLGALLGGTIALREFFELSVRRS